MSDTREEIAHWGQPMWSRIELIQIFASLSTMIILQFSPLARCRAHRIALASAAIGVLFGINLDQAFNTAPCSFLATTARAEEF